MPVTKFSFKSSERLRNGNAYVVDTGMLAYRKDNLSAENLGRRLEDVILLELLRRNPPTNGHALYILGWI